MIGKRQGYGTEYMAPHNLMLTLVGTSLLWVGWFGFNAGSALSSGELAGSAMLNTHISAAVAALVWMAIEWASRGKPSVLGILSGAVAGLGTITPAAGYVEPWAAMLIGVAAGAVCYWASVILKTRLGYDDSLDVFGVHGVGGILGTILSACSPPGPINDVAKGQPVGLVDGNARPDPDPALRRGGRRRLLRGRHLGDPEDRRRHGRAPGHARRGDRGSRHGACMASGCSSRPLELWLRREGSQTLLPYEESDLFHCCYWLICFIQ